MAAIFGFANYNGDTVTRLEVMARSLVHRGATKPQFFKTEHASIGVRALTRRQANEVQVFGWSGGNIRVVLDGKIVNAISLSEQIHVDRHNPAFPNSAEIVAHLYRSYGESCFELLRGSFAVAIHDIDNDRLILARDHLGHKPLFFANTSEGFFFASETKALLAADVVPFAIDMQALSHFLSLRFVPAPYSLIRGITKLPPAHLAVFQRGKLSIRQYWKPSFASKMRPNLDDVIEGLEEKVRDAIAAYLSDSGNVGSFLSGGLDSGLIVANMSQVLGKPFDTFSLGVENDSDEVPIARLVAEKYGSIQHEYYPRDDIVSLLPVMIWSLDEPSDMVLVSKFLLSRMAAPHVDSVMSGDGGDELFAGFTRYLGLRDAQHYAHVPAWFRKQIIRPIARQLGGRKGLNGIAGKVLWLTEVTGAGELPERYAEAVEYLRFRNADKQDLFSVESWSLVQDVDSSKLLAEKVRSSDAEDTIEKLLHTDFLTRLPEHLLMLDDRTGAAHGIEVLCPFADKELVEYATSIPADMKIRGRQAKFIERKLAERKLPMEAVNFNKTGWSYPFAALCAGPLQPFLRSVFADARLIKDGIFQQAAVERIISEHGAGKVDHHIRIWMLLSLEIWYRMMSEKLHYEDMIPWMDAHMAS
jgi:asparagine synthase (glutamine-hydrolysing)